MIDNTALLQAQIAPYLKKRPHVRPLGDNVVVLPKYAETELTKLGGLDMDLRISEGGVALPQIVDNEPIEGEVVALGDGLIEDCPRCFPEGKRHRFEVQIGDRVLFIPWDAVSVDIDDTEFFVLSERSILGIFPKAS